MKKITFFLAFLCFIQNTYGQSAVVEKFQNLNVLNAQLSQDFTRIAQFSKYSTAQLVRIDPLSNGINSRGNLKLSLNNGGLEPESCQNLEFAPRSTRFINDQNYYYYGDLVKGDAEACSCQDGEIMLEAVDGKKFGYVTIDDARYEFEPLDGTYNVMAKVNPSFLGEKAECGVVEVDSENGKRPNQQAAASDREGGPCVIKVLFLYTPAAAARYTAQGLYVMATGGISSMNQALSNSYVPNISVVKTHVYLLPGFVENPATIEADHTTLMTSPAVTALRNSDEADVVCLITDGNYERFEGVSGMNKGAPMFSQAFMLVEGSSFNTHLTFCHELGHIMGCRHQTSNTFNDAFDDAGTIEHGSNWTEGRWPCKKICTDIMHILDNSVTRVLHYSNPNVLHNGVATGTTTSENTASWISNTNGCTVANYFPDPMPDPLTTRIEGKEYLCKGETGHYTALASMSGSLSYEWHKTLNGVQWGQPIGNTQSINLNTSNYPIGQYIFLRVRVSNNQGMEAFAFFEVTVIDPNGPSCPRTTEQDATDINDLEVYPNPASDDFFVNFNVADHQTKVNIQAYSALGGKILEFDKILDEGKFEERFSTTGFASGPILVQVKIGDKTYNQIVIKK